MSDIHDSIPARHFYEGVRGGWKDGRLGQAYDIISKVQKEQSASAAASFTLNHVLRDLEEADTEIEKDL